MVELFRKYREIYKAAEKAGVPKNQAVKVFNRPAFQEELDRQDEAVRAERARQEVRDEKLTNEVIDRELLSVILLPVDKHGSLKLEAIRLGAVMTGRIQAGNTKMLGAGDGPEKSGAANFYQAIVQVQEAAPLLPQAAGDASGSAPIVPVAAAAAVAPAVAPQPATKPEMKHETKPAGKTGVIRLG